MVSKRKRRSSPPQKGLVAGEKLKRNKLAGNDASAWGWVDTEVADVSRISREHCMRTCGFSKKSKHPFCPNKYATNSRSAPAVAKHEAVHGELEDDVIVISDDETPTCSRKSCKNNPNCLNYLGQEKWEDEEDAWDLFLKAYHLGDNPILDSRDPDLPVGLRNLGATCYANAFLQVWFRDLAFRSGVYQCQASKDAKHDFEESPIFQLQVTFAALQESTQSVFNPTKLVESLQLRTSEQQDAQEFSKLFMSHLDLEFQKQSNPSLRSLIADQFQGKQVYGTICENCHFRSERVSDFLEIEISFENNAGLEDCIAALLQPETLTGDNKYLCSRCESLQDATRYSELRQLPPVLHFSLLRFVYDMSSMERKKSKHTISFPSTIDMGRFLGSAAARKAANQAVVSASSTQEYELRGVLLHKGASAYHGHYEAQVYDVREQAWFQFNDETVTKIVTLGSHSNGKDEVTKPSVKARAKKRRRVDDSDDDDTQEVKLNHTSGTSSRDAYMLIYARKGDTLDFSSDSQVPKPPVAALQVVNKLNAAHDGKCDRFMEKEKQAKTHFETLRRRVMDIYRSWNVSHNEENSVIVSREDLENWLSRDAIQASLLKAGGGSVDGSTKDGSSSTRDSHSPHLSASQDYICVHEELDPRNAAVMKRITQAAYSQIQTDTEYSLSTALSPEQVCCVCVSSIFTERLYQIEHPRIVARFDQVCDVEDGSSAYWIPKEWLKDWRLVNPKMHQASRPDDPDPDDVKCEHGCLSHNSTSRRRISAEACQILQGLFPTWEPVNADAELCAVCDALIHISKEDKRGSRKRAEDEKAILKHMHDNALNGNTALLENVPCAIIPAQFVRSWRQWLNRPADNPRPDTFDNLQFICEHSLLAFDPNSEGDWDASLAIIKRTDWDTLEDLYSGGPLISLEKKLVEDGGVSRIKYVHDVPVCGDCRLKKKLDFDIADITIRIWGANDPIPDGNTLDDHSLHNINRQRSIVTYCSKKGGAVRQSKRIRQAKERGVRKRMTVMKDTSVKDIKLFLQSELDMPTIYQRLFYKGHELEDNSSTVMSLGLQVNDIIDACELTENTETDNDDPGPARKRKREEERGFGGTLLGGSSKTDVVNDIAREEIPTVANEKSCSACTFANPVDVVSCGICDTPFA